MTEALDKTSATERKLNLKVLLTMILGGLWLVNFVYSRAGTLIHGFFSLYYIVIGVLSPLLLWTGMFMCALKKKTPARILIITYFVLRTGGTIYEILNYFSSGFAVSAAEYFSADTIISWVVSIGSLTLLLLYVLIGWRRRDSLAWMLIYLGICLCSHLVSVWQSHLYVQTDGSLRQLVDDMTRPNILTSGLPNLIYTSFFAIVLSPDKWYRQK